MRRQISNHKHTDECLAYAAQTGKAFCIAECRDARKDENIRLDANYKNLIDIAFSWQLDEDGDRISWRALYADLDMIRIELEERLEENEQRGLDV